MSQKGFAHILIIVVLAIGVVILGAALWANYKNGHLNWRNDGFSEISQPSKDLACPDNLCNPSVQEQLPRCVGNNYLTVSPIDLDILVQIAPIGLIHPPGHALPMDHMLLSLAADKEDNILKTGIKAPGKVHINKLRRITYKQDGEVQHDQYSMTFSSCRELIFYFEGLSNLSANLKKEAEKSTCIWSSQKEGNREFVFCEYLVDYVAEPGEIIGTGGEMEIGSKSLDWGSYDTRIPRHPFIGRGDEGPNGAVFYTACPLDYYSSPLKDQLYDKLTRKVEPRCGEVMQDKLGTIQGNWQAKKEFRKAESTSWSPFLGIGHNAHDPSVGVIGVAGTISDVGIIGFNPKHDGKVNREPSEITADGQIYCYQHDATPPWSGDPELSGRIILQLIDARTLKIEYQEKSCDESLNFISPTIYER